MPRRAATTWTGCRRCARSISLADFNDSTWVNLTGASGHAFHPNYDDQTPLWQANRTRPWKFTVSAVEKSAKDTLVLKAKQ